MEKIDLPLPTNATSRGPVIESRCSKLSLKYDHESEDGTMAWVAIQFGDVLAYEVYQSICSVPESLVPSNQIRCLRESILLSEVLNRWSEAVGWQEHQKRLGGESRFMHYQIYFDDVCSVQVIAATCEIEQPATASCV
jgi:hypothetical protein